MKVSESKRIERELGLTENVLKLFPEITSMREDKNTSRWGIPDKQGYEVGGKG